MSNRDLLAASLASKRASGTQRQQGSQQHLREDDKVSNFKSDRYAVLVVTTAGSHQREHFALAHCVHCAHAGM
jgi:hypothetical protein